MTAARGDIDPEIRFFSEEVKVEVGSRIMGFNPAGPWHTDGQLNVLRGVVPGTPDPRKRGTGDDDAFDDRDVLLKYYETQAEEFRLRHAAWEGIQHYTWLLSLLLGWPVALLSAKNLDQLWHYVPYFVSCPFWGSSSASSLSL